MFHGPFDLPVNFSPRLLGKFKIPSLQLHKEFNSLCSCKLGILNLPNGRGEKFPQRPKGPGNMTFFMVKLETWRGHNSFSFSS